MLFRLEYEIGFLENSFKSQRLYVSCIVGDEFEFDFDEVPYLRSGVSVHCLFHFPPCSPLVLELFIYTYTYTIAHCAREHLNDVINNALYCRNNDITRSSCQYFSFVFSAFTKEPRDCLEAKIVSSRVVLLN